MDKIAFVGVTGNLMLWVAGNDIGDRNKEFVRNTLGHDFGTAWETGKKIFSENPEKILLPIDVAVESEGSRRPLSVSDLPTEDPIYDIGLQTLASLKPLVENADAFSGTGQHLTLSSPISHLAP